MIKYLLPLTLSLSCFSQTIKENNELLWEISGNGLTKGSFLFGSLHSNDKRIFNMSDSTYYALEKANVISLETDIFSLFDTWDTRKGSVNVHYDDKGDPYITTSDATETLYGNEDGMPQFLDAYFQQYCYNAGKNFAPLESVDFQLNLFADVRFPEMNDFNLMSLLTSKEDMLDLYIAGDIYRMDELLRTSLSIYTHGYQGLIVDRNVQMAEKIDSILQVEGNRMFCAVGAGHLASNTGLIKLLRSKGYNVRKVTASYSETPVKSKIEVSSKKYYLYQNDTIGIHAQFPGMPKLVTNGDEDYLMKLIYRDFGQGNTYDVEVYNRTEEIGLKDLARMYIASPAQSPFVKLELDNGGEACQGLADSYPEGIYWVRVIMNEDYFLVIKAYGGNKFMHSKRAQKFFDKVWFE